MLKILFLVLFIVYLGQINDLYGQNVQSKTDELIAALNKTKYKNKSKKNVSIEVYVNVKSEAIVKSDVREYSGVYESGSDYRLELRVSAADKIEGKGYDDDNSSGGRNFTLKDARIEGALLTATKIFENGETVKFEAVFNNHTVTQGKNPNQIESRQTKFGLGFIQSNSNWTNRVFLELK